MTLDKLTMTKPSRPFAAFAWMGGALASFTLIAVASREAGRSVDTMQIMLYRGLIALAILVVIGRATGARFRSEHIGLHGARSIVHFIAQYSWLYAVMLIPLAQLTAIEFTAPLWVAMLAPLVVQERLTLVRITAAVAGFAGVLVVMRPDAAEISLGSLLALVAALGFAGTMLVTKLLTRTDSAFTILFYMMLLQTVLSVAIGIWTLVVPDLATLGWIATLSLFGLVAHYSLARAITLADAIIVAPMDFLRLPLVALVGGVLYAEPLDGLVLLGGAIVIAGNMLNLWGEWRQSSRRDRQ